MTRDAHDERGAAVLERTWLTEIERFERAVVSWVGHDGYPVNAPASFRADHARDRVVLEDLHAPDLPEGGTVLVTFSHIRPRPGVGYDERRYVNVRGRLDPVDGELTVTADEVTGWDEERVPFFEYCERNVARGLAYMRRLSEQRGTEVRPRLSPGWTLFSATRVPFLTATLVPVLLGAMVARAHGFSAWWLMALTLLGASCIHLGLNVLNDVFDTASGADDANVTPTPFSGGSRVLQHGLVSRRTMWTLAGFFFATGSGIGVALAATRGVEILWLGLAGVFLSVFYTAPPFKLAYRGLGDVAVAAGFGPIMVLGSEFVIAQELTFEAFFASLPVAILIMLVLYVNQVPDRVGDARAGKRTVAVRLSRDAIIRGYVASAAAAFALVAVGAVSGILTPWALLALAPAPLAVKVSRGLVAHYDEPYGLMPAMGANIGLHALTGLALILAYVLEITA